MSVTIGETYFVITLLNLSLCI